jgi:hypothetical protein
VGHPAHPAKKSAGAKAQIFVGSRAPRSETFGETTY